MPARKIKFGNWTVLKLNVKTVKQVYPSGNKTQVTYHLCRCKCGLEKLKVVSELKRGASTQCHSCAASGENHPGYKHGLSGTREYKAWSTMHRRCYLKTSHRYKNYGARGIAVCKRWHKFENFFKNMGKCPKNFTLERIDNDKSYCPSNCRWASKLDQARNKQSSIKIFRNGIRIALTDECKKHKISREAVRSRIKNGWDLEEALTTPVDRAANVARVHRLRKQKELYGTEETT